MIVKPHHFAMFREGWMPNPLFPAAWDGADDRWKAEFICEHWDWFTDEMRDWALQELGIQLVRPITDAEYARMLKEARDEIEREFLKVDNAGE